MKSIGGAGMKRGPMGRLMKRFKGFG
jgi:hypothetical protein